MSPLRLGVLVPARDEVTVLERKLRNLARQAWPAGAQHRVLVVDDRSNDGTGALVERLLPELRAACPQADWELARGPGAGKARAIRSGLDALGEPPERCVDVVVLTDADVVLDEGALLAFAQAFRTRPELALASGVQRFVQALDPGGAPCAPGGGPLRPAGDVYDRLTAWVRALESRSGRVFSVHGQLLAWRLTSDLRPTPGFAADDLDLMFAARAGGGRVCMVPEAAFLETKPAAGAPRDGQQRRRAEGYFQVLEGWAARRPLRRGWPDRLQWWFYATVPGASPRIALGAALALLLLAALRGPGALAVTSVVLGLVAVSPLGREVRELARIIRAARRNVPPARDAGFDRWHPPRGLA